MRKLLCALALCMALTGCARLNVGSGELPRATVLADEIPEIPEKLDRTGDGVPVLRVYDTADGKVHKIDAETYVEGVLAGEMRNDWPLEALKAQAILARTFVMQFVAEKESQYDGADISTDVSEAQAYRAEAVNARVKQAVRETRGLVLSADGDVVHAWFHAHAGGQTELASVGLDYEEGDPDYIVPVTSPDSEKAPDDVKHWRAEFSAEAVGKACAEAGVATGPVREISVARKGASGRAAAFLVNGKTVSAPALRIQLDPGKLKSTLIDSMELADGKVVFTGRGYGHGVGLSQWGAYALAERGLDAEKIIEHYFQNVEIVPMWS